MILKFNLEKKRKSLPKFERKENKKTIPKLDLNLREKKKDEKTIPKLESICVLKYDFQTIRERVHLNLRKNKMKRLFLNLNYICVGFEI